MASVDVVKETKCLQKLASHQSGISFQVVVSTDPHCEYALDSIQKGQGTSNV